MKRTLLLITITTAVFSFAQKKTSTTANQRKASEKYQSMQPQDLSVPPPPINDFPAQFPEGNKKFVEKVIKNLNAETLKDQPEKLSTEVILKIDATGKVLNISSFGNNEVFNNEVVKVANKITSDINWKPAQNKTGKKVIDLVRLPVKYSKK